MNQKTAIARRTCERVARLNPELSVRELREKMDEEYPFMEKSFENLYIWVSEKSRTLRVINQAPELGGLFTERTEQDGF